jgi:hypothetical protein
MERGGAAVIEICHNIERVAQPVPARNPGGDCFACAATAGLRFLYPERSIALDDVWDMFVVEYYDGRAQENLRKLREAVGEHLDGTLDAERLRGVFNEVSAEKPRTTTCNTWSGFKDVLEKAGRAWGRLEVTWDMVEPHFDHNHGSPHWSYAWRYQDLDLDYSRRLEGWLRSGWVAFAEIRMHGGGPFEQGPDGTVMLRSIDHFIVIDGVRHRYVEERTADGKFQYGSWKDEIHVVDSSGLNLTGWHDTMRFTRSHGASSWWLARRDSR